MVGAKRVATLSVRSVTELGVVVGRAWTADLAEAVAESERADLAVHKARGYLSRRPHTHRQLDLKLNQAGFEAKARREALERLDRAGLIDDRAYAERLIEELKQRKGAGPRLVRSKLAAAGVDGKTVDELMSQGHGDELSEPERAMAYAESQLGGLRRLEPEAAKRRLYGRMARRGYDTSVIREVVERLLGGETLSD